MGEVESAIRALVSAASALDEAMPQLDLVVMVGAAVAAIALLAVMLPRSR